MHKFAFIIHPIDPKIDVSRKFPFLGKILSEKQINFFSTFFPPIYISEIEGITSQATGSQIQGWFVACPLTPTRMLELPEKTVYKKIIQTGRLAERLGAELLGLGAFTSVIGDSGLTISQNLNIPTTTGDSLTVAIAVEAVIEAAHMLEIVPKETIAAVVGATGSIGKVCAEILAEKVKKIYLIGRRKDTLDQLKKSILDRSSESNMDVSISTDLSDIQNAQIIITVTSAIDTIIEPDLLQPGSVICDVSRPRDVSSQIANSRKDILVIDGGMVDIPGNPNFNFNFGFPEGKAYACMAETMVLALEGRLESFTIGKQITKEQVEEIYQLAIHHGFKLSGFRSFEKPVMQDTIDQIKTLTKKSRITKSFR